MQSGSSLNQDTQGAATSLESDANPRPKNIATRFQKGVSGNPSGRPRIEPRVRRFARRYDRRMCKVLASIAEDEEAPMAERRRAAMDLISVGSGRPALVQEIAGRNGEQLAPLVALNFGSGSGHSPLTPSDAYKLMIEGRIDADPAHPAFAGSAIEHQPAVSAEKSEES
jgi:hypothetical protein